MKTCSKTTRVTAELQPDGDTIKIRIASDCPHVKEYAQLLGDTIHTADAVEWRGSRIVDPDIRQPLSITCLLPNAIFNAAWIELGMLSKHLAQDMAKENDLVFVKDGQ